MDAARQIWKDRIPNGVPVLFERLKVEADPKIKVALLESLGNFIGQTIGFEMKLGKENYLMEDKEINRLLEQNVGPLVGEKAMQFHDHFVKGKQFRDFVSKLEKDSNEDVRKAATEVRGKLYAAGDRTEAH